MREITVAELHKMIESGTAVTVVDVRTPLEFRLGHISGAINVPLGKPLPQDLVAGGGTVAVVCQSGHRSASACQIFAKQVKNLANVQGGMGAWGASKFSTAKAPPGPRSIDRQAHFVAATILAASLYVGHSVNPVWFNLAGLPLFGLTLDALTGFCPVTVLLKQMPWNKS
ncbi:MAG: rhodanese-like domain-containing protein [Armatimonadetes bacterium]|nr:rhodanese-like domain-containing protein [Armatimonadota bacterium]